MASSVTASETADDTRKHCDAAPPTLLKLKTMKGADGKPLKIIQTIAANDYTTFGMCLLQDENGEAVALIEKDHKGAASVTEAILKKWLTSDSPTHTYQHLIECLRWSEMGALAKLIANTGKTEQMRSVAQNQDFAHRSHTATKTSYQMTSLQNPSSFASYASYLKERYSSMSQSHTSQHWSHLPRCEFIQLAMIGNEEVRRGDREEEMVRLAQQGRIETIMSYKEPVDFADLFPLPPSQPLVVLPPPPCPRVLLLEGAPGGGKSTLALYVCQKWADNASFLAIFDLVVIVYLRDEAIQNATTLADLLPTTDSMISQTVANHINSSCGRNVLFVFDGWDEFPSHLQDSSIVASIIKEPHQISLHQSTVLITSRPVSSGNLLHIADRRVEILGFTRLQIREYIDKALLGNSTNIQKLVQHLEEHPVIEGYCYVPLHVAILVHIFLTMKGALPTTLHELFCNLVLCCIVRELETHETEKILSAVSWSSLDDLSEDLKSKLNDLCVLAYEGVMQNKVVFNQKDVRGFHLPADLPSLGLLQAVEGLTLLSKSLSYNFLHLSVQELLAAYHISHMNSTKQLVVFKHMFGSSRFQAVLHYYSGFTKLANPAIQDFISSFAKQALIKDLLPLLHCFYEAQEPSLCKLVGHEFAKCIELNSSYLNPVDYLAIGYFATSFLSAHVPTSIISSEESNIRLKIIAIDDHQLKLLQLELLKHPIQRSDRQLYLEFYKTMFTTERAKVIATLLEKLVSVSELTLRECNFDAYSSLKVIVAESLRNESNLLSLQVFGPIIFEHTSTHQQEQKSLALNKDDWPSTTHLACDIFKALKYNNTLVRLILSRIELVANAHIAKALTRMLQVNKTLTHLDLSHNRSFSNSGVRDICSGLYTNTTLLYLNLSGTKISDEGANHISQFLKWKHNQSLKTLDISNNQISDKGLESIMSQANDSLHILKCHQEVISEWQQRYHRKRRIPDLFDF